MADLPRQETARQLAQVYAGSCSRLLGIFQFPPAESIEILCILGRDGCAAVQAMDAATAAAAASGITAVAHGRLRHLQQARCLGRLRPPYSPQLPQA